MSEENKTSTTDTTPTTASTESVTPSAVTTEPTTTESTQTPVTTTTTDIHTSTPVSVPDMPAMPVSDSVAPAATFAWKPYAIAAAVIILMGVALLFVMEQQGRTNTSYFSGFTKMMAGPAATVNGVAIKRTDFDRNFEQVMREVAAQGFGAELDPTMEATLKEQAVQSLINAELLAQAAVAAGMTVEAEAIEARMAEIEAGNNGPEELAIRMAEFGITMEQLRSDVERELLIQAHLNEVLNLESLTVSDEEVAEVYEQIVEANAGAEIPPLAEVSDLVRNQIIGDRQQQLVGEYIDELRQTATIVINV